MKAEPRKWFGRFNGHIIRDRGKMRTHGLIHLEHKPALLQILLWLDPRQVLAIVVGGQIRRQLRVTADVGPDKADRRFKDLAHDRQQ